MKTCQECGKESKYVVCTECFDKAVHELSDEKCHNCDKPCKPCYDFEDDSTQVYHACVDCDKPMTIDEGGICDSCLDRSLSSNNPNLPL